MGKKNYELSNFEIVCGAVFKLAEQGEDILPEWRKIMEFLVGLGKINRGMCLIPLGDIVFEHSKHNTKVHPQMMTDLKNLIEEESFPIFQKYLIIDYLSQKMLSIPTQATLAASGGLSRSFIPSTPE